MQLKAAFILLTILLLTGACRTIKPPLPSVTDNMVQPTALPPSKIDIPVSIDLTKTFAQLNDSIPTTLFSDNWPNMQPSGDCGVEYKWRFKRTPITVNLSGSNINIYATAYYGTEARFRPCCSALCPWIGVSCGNDNLQDTSKINGLFFDTITPTAQIKLGLTSAISIEKNYQLNTHTTLSKFEPLNRCRVTFLRIDITDRILDKARTPINQALQEFDNKISQYNLRAELDSIWRQLFTPLQVDTLGFVLVNPEEVRLGPIKGDGNKIDFTVGLTARPVFSFENPGQQTAIALPDIAADAPGNAFILYMDGKLQYTVLSVLLNSALTSACNIRLDKSGYLHLAQAQVLGTGGQQLLIKLNFSGKFKGTAYNGWLYLTGMPVYNPLTGELVLADLDFTLETKNILVKSAGWLLRSKIKEVLKANTKWNVTQTLNTLKTGLTGALNKQVSQQLSLQGNIDHLDIVGILPLTDYLLLRTTANGNVRANVMR